MPARGKMTRSSVVAAIVVAALLAILMRWRDGRVERSTEALSPSSAARSPGQVVALPAQRPVSQEALLSTAPAPVPAHRPYTLPPMTAEMQERRRRVLGSRRTTPPAAAQASAASGQAASDAPAPMKDKTGMMGPEVKALNEQFLPLVDQCFDQAKERGVRGHGMIALEVKFAGAEDVGRIIESVEPGSENAVHDPELIDCLRQSAFTVDLPAPTEASTSEAMLTIPFEGAPGDAGTGTVPR